MSTIKANYHCHCDRCCHAVGTEEDYVKYAIENELSILGISDHAPFPDIDYGYRMQFDELEDYFSTIDMLKDKYKDKISILKSLEIEYLPQYDTFYDQLRTNNQVDYLLLGEHFFYDNDGSLANIFSAPDSESYLAYAKMISQAAHTGYFDILAHPDLYMFNNNVWDKNCEKAADIIIQAAVDTGIILEANANGIRRGLSEYPDGTRYPYPHENFWKKVSGSSARVIVGSDCHEPQFMWDDSMIMTFDFLNSLDITPLSRI